jgi:hypothetical protein
MRDIVAFHFTFSEIILHRIFGCLGARLLHLSADILVANF